MVGQQVQRDGSAAVLLDCLADLGGQRVDQTAFDSFGRNDELTLARGATGKCEAYRFKRRAGKFIQQMLAPGFHFEATVCGAQ